MALRPAIMCGGSGTRLWPLSRKAAPKQLQPLVSDRSMLLETALRLDHIAGQSGAMVLTSAAYADAAMQDMVAAGLQGVTAIVEPDGRNTAPAAAMAALHAMEDDPDALVLLLASDHHVAKPEAFAAAVAAGVPLAEEGALVTFGIRPDHPETGYGYIQRGQARGGGYQVKAFREKPDFVTAQHYVTSGTYDWNAGIFLYKASAFLDVMATTAPELLAAVQQAWAGRTSQGGQVHPDPAAWATIKGNSIDYAVAEKAPDVVVVPVDMGWSDVGSFDSLWAISPKDARQNSSRGDVTLIDCKRTLVRATSRQVSVIGVEDLVVIETADAVLVVPRDRAQDVKAAVAALTEAGRTELL